MRGFQTSRETAAPALLVPLYVLYSLGKVWIFKPLGVLFKSLTFGNSVKAYRVVMGIRYTRPKLQDSESELSNDIKPTFRDPALDRGKPFCVSIDLPNGHRLDCPKFTNLVAGRVLCEIFPRRAFRDQGNPKTGVVNEGTWAVVTLQDISSHLFWPWQGIIRFIGHHNPL